MTFSIKKVLNNSFFKSVVVMISGTASAQIITMLLAPIITRLYGPEAYGLMGTFMAIVAIIGPISALTYPIAIVLPKSERDANGLQRLSIYISVIVSLVLVLILLVFNKQIELYLKSIVEFLYLLPLVALFSGLMQVAEQRLIRNNQFKDLAKVTFFQALILDGSKVIVGFYKPIAAVLIVLTAFRNGIKALLMTIFYRKSTHNNTTSIKEDKISLKKIAKRYYDFPMFRAPEVFINAISQNLPVIMLASFFGPASAGFYSLGRTVLSLPSQLISKSVGDVFYPRISTAAYNGENLTKMIIKATFFLGAVGLIPYGLVIVFGPYLFSFVFGMEWEMAGIYARWIALWLFFMFINQPSVRALPVLSAQFFHLKFTIFTLVIRVLGLGIGYYVFNSDIVAIVLFCISGAILNIILILITIRISSKDRTVRR